MMGSNTVGLWGIMKSEFIGKMNFGLNLQEKLLLSEKKCIAGRECPWAKAHRTKGARALGNHRASLGWGAGVEVDRSLGETHRAFSTLLRYLGFCWCTEHELLRFAAGVCCNHLLWRH